LSVINSEGSELAQLFQAHRERLRRMVSVRMDRRLLARLDPSDVLQDAFLEAAKRFDAYAQKAEMPPFLWLRFLVGERLQALHRRHLGVKARDPRREVSVIGGLVTAATSEALAAQLVGQTTSPSQAAMRAELHDRLRKVLDSMPALDREVLALRHFEQLTNVETAQTLGTSERAASNRYIRALRRMNDLLQTMPEFFES
jgi:RNA polymerase sigma-70 factor (ECF subfamily)